MLISPGENFSRSSKIAALTTALPWEWGPTSARLFGSLIFDICSPVCFRVAPVFAALRGAGARLANRDRWLQTLRGSEVQTAISISARYVGLAISQRFLLPSESPCQACGTQALRRVLFRRTNCSSSCIGRKREEDGWLGRREASRPQYGTSNPDFGSIGVTIHLEDGNSVAAQQIRASSFGARDRPGLQGSGRTSSARPR